MKIVLVSILWILIGPFVGLGILARILYMPVLAVIGGWGFADLLLRDFARTYLRGAK